MNKKKIIKISLLSLLGLVALFLVTVLLIWHNEIASVHSAIYNMTTKTAYWVPNENYEDPAAWFTFKVGK